MKRFLLLIIICPLVTLAQNKRVDSLKRELALANADTLKALIYHQLAFELAKMDHITANKMSDECLRISKKVGFYKGIAKAYSFRALVGSYTGNFPMLKANADTCLDISLKHSIPSLAATAYTALGIYYWQTGDYSVSIENHLAALKIREKLNEELNIAKSLGNIGQVYLDNNKFKEAETYTMRCLAVARKLNDGYTTVAALHIMANIASGQQQYHRALQFDTEALPICYRENNKRGLSQIYSNMARCYSFLKQYDRALKYQMEVLTIDKFFGDKKQVADTYLNIGEIFKNKADYTQAMVWLNRALSLSTETQYKQGQKSSWQFISEVHEQTGNYKNALKAHQKYQALSTEIINEKSVKEITFTEAKYKTEKKEQQITLLNKENTIQKLSIDNRNKTIAFITGGMILAAIAGFLFYNRQKLQQRALMQQQKIEQQTQLTQAIIDAEEKERSRIASDLHDGVGQLFSAVKMNLNGLFDRISMPRPEDRFLAEKTLALVDESCREVREISHQMMPNNLLQRSGIASDVKSFIEKIDGESLKVIFEATGFKNKLESNVEIVLYRVIQETVNNVIKHSKATTLDITLTRTAKGINATVTDNGIGFTIDDRFDGIGLKNIATRIEYLKGDVTYTTAPGKGTRVKIWVPIG
ncbi:MAG: sensor histidine kinase [Bacteroidota bacterium]